MGLILVYTGDGKGKTTAALGLVVRAYGHGLRSIVAHVMKTLIYRGQWVGEYLALSRMSDLVEVYYMSETALRTPRDVFNRAIERSIEVKPFLLILDEINNAVDNGLMSAGEVIEGIRKLPSEVNVVLTGRGAPREFLEIADLVTEFRAVKHYYDRGVVGVMGLEW